MTGIFIMPKRGLPPPTVLNGDFRRIRYGQVLLVATMVSAGLLLPAGALRADDAEPPTVVELPPPADPDDRSIELDRGRFMLDWIEDRTDLKGTADFEAFHRMFKHVQKVDQQQLREAADAFIRERWESGPFSDWPPKEFPLFYDITQHPDEYRGKPVTLRGHIQLHRVRHHGETGEVRTHEVWLYTGDSQSHPAIVLFANNPSGIPAGEDYVGGIVATGYFLKLYPYQARDGRRFAPLILAKEIHQVSPPETSRSVLIGISATIVGVTLAFLLFMMWQRRREAAARERHRQLLEDESQPDFDSI